MNTSNDIIILIVGAYIIFITTMLLPPLSFDVLPVAATASVSALCVYCIYMVVDSIINRCVDAYIYIYMLCALSQETNSLYDGIYGLPILFISSGLTIFSAGFIMFDDIAYRREWDTNSLHRSQSQRSDKYDRTFSILDDKLT